MNILEMRQKRQKVYEDAKAMLLTISDDMDPTIRAEREAAVDKAITECDELQAKIDRAERMAKLERDKDLNAQRVADDEGTDKDEVIEGDDRYEALFNQFATGAPMDAADIAFMRNHSTLLKTRSGKIVPVKAAQSTTGGAGGYTIPEGFSGQMEMAMLAFGGVAEAATVWQTTTGNNIPWPTMNDTGNEGVLLGENTEDAEQDATDGEIVFGAYKYSSRIIRVSVELLQDSAFDFGNIVGGRLAERLARIRNRHATTGTGSSQPNGIVTASTLGHTAAANAAITHDDLVDLEHSVDPAYRNMPGCRWMFHDTVLKALKKLKDNDGRPLWVVNAREGAPDTLGGYQWTVNQHMAQLGAGAKTVLFGDMTKYMFRDVLGITLRRLVERYAEYHQVGFVAISRFDGDLLDAGTNPVKYLQQSSG